MRLACPYLSAEVELTAERERHVAAHHPDLLPAHRQLVVRTLADPDEVRQDADYPDTRLFVRRFHGALPGKSVVVVTVTDEVPDVRHWVVTAFISRRPPKGDLEWRRP
ncbi:MAG: hypothetical protein FJ291_19540 [Planctomycetes bacterium]|nr:hypothetical protein [Planctomycetota bacterium]